MNRWLEMTCYGLVQAAEMAGVSRATFWRLIKRGVVSATRAEDGSYQIEASELDRYLTSTAIERARRGAVNKPETTGEPDHEQPHDGPQSLAGPTALLDSAGRSGLLRCPSARLPLTAGGLDSERADRQGADYPDPLGVVLGYAPPLAWARGPVQVPSPQDRHPSGPLCVNTALP